MKLTNQAKDRQLKHFTGSPVLGIALILAASVFFSIMGLGVRLGRDDFRADNLVFYRSIIQMLLLAPYLKPQLGLKQFRFHFLRGLFGIFSMISAVSSIQRLPLAFATLLCMTGVVWGVIFSRIFLGEKMTRNQLIAITIACIGLFLVALPSGNQSTWVTDWAGIALGLASGISMGGAHTLIRKMRLSNTSAYEIVFFFGISGILLTLPGFLSHPQFPMTLHHWRTIMMVGLVGSTGQLLMTWGFKYATTVAGSLCILQQTPINVLIGLFVLGETPPKLFFVGFAAALAGLAGVVYFSKTKSSVGYDPGKPFQNTGT